MSAEDGIGQVQPSLGGRRRARRGVFLELGRTPQTADLVGEAATPSREARRGVERFENDHRV